MFDVIDTLFDELYKGLNDKINKNESIKDYFLTMNDNEIKKLSYLISEELEKDIDLEDTKENLVNYIIVNLDPLVKGILKYCDDSTFDKFTKIPNYIEYKTEEEVLYIIDLFLLNAFHIAKANYNEKKDTITVFIHNEIKDLLDKYIKDKEIKKINKMYNKIYNTIELVLDTYGVISVDVLEDIIDKNYSNFNNYSILNILILKSMADEGLNLYMYKDNLILIGNSEFYDKDFTRKFYDKIDNFKIYNKDMYESVYSFKYISNTKGYNKLIKYLFEELNINIIKDINFNENIVRDYMYQSQTSIETADEYYFNKIKRFYRINKKQAQEINKILKEIFSEMPKWSKGGKI